MMSFAVTMMSFALTMMNSDASVESLLALPRCATRSRDRSIFTPTDFYAKSDGFPLISIDFRLKSDDFPLISIDFH